MTRKLLCSVLLVAFMSVAAQAALIGLPNIEHDGATVPGNVINDVRISFTGQWFSGQLLTQDLAPGSVHQDTTLTGGINFHTPFLNIADSYIANGTLGLGGLVVQEVGAAVNLDATDAATRPALFNEDKIDFAWAAGTGLNTPANKNDWVIAHIILADTANGSFTMLVSTTGEEKLILEGFIIDGQMTWVPEPATMALMGLGGLLIARRRR